MTAHPLSSTAKKILHAALTETNPNSIAAATSLTVQAVYANLSNLKKQNLAIYDSEAKVLTLTDDGIRVANEPDTVSTETIVEPTDSVDTTAGAASDEKVQAPAALNVVVTGTAKKKDIAWAIIGALLSDTTRTAPITRKEIIDHLVREMGILANNASAYYQNYRKAHGMVAARKVKAEVAPAAVVETPTATTTENEIGLGVDEVLVPDDVADEEVDPMDSTAI